MVTVVTITRNNFDELLKTLKSISDQKSIESIIVNGGECERTLEYLKEYTGVAINEPDEGIADAFNKGIIASKGDYLMFLNSGDELIDGDYIKKAEKIFLENQNISFIHSNLLLEDSIAGNILMKPRMKNIGRGMPYLHPTMIVRKIIFNKIGLFNNRKKIAMDFDYIVRMEKEKFRGFYLEESAVVKMEGRGSSILKEYEALQECYDSLKEYKCLDLITFCNFNIRLTLFLIRKLMISSGLSVVLGIFKRIKYKQLI
jgi:glycosyltransferase involved in cell wall biosynthesis